MGGAKKVPAAKTSAADSLAKQKADAGERSLLSCSLQSEASDLALSVAGPQCTVCRQTFTITQKRGALRIHQEAKHPKSCVVRQVQLSGLTSRLQHVRGALPDLGNSSRIGSSDFWTLCSSSSVEHFSHLCLRHFSSSDLLISALLILSGLAYAKRRSSAKFASYAALQSEERTLLARQTTLKRVTPRSNPLLLHPSRQPPPPPPPPLHPPPPPPPRPPPLAPPPPPAPPPPRR